MTDWSGHIDVLVGMTILIFIQAFVNILIYNKFRRIDKFMKHIRGVY